MRGKKRVLKRGFITSTVEMH